MTRLQRALLTWYARHGRRNLPWRVTRDPYKVLVSELMLHQTQVERVRPKYNEFVEAFPSFSALARAGTDQVIRAWKDLGYNSRAVHLKRLAQQVSVRHAGLLPREKEALQALPGVGPYTAAAVRAFAFEQDEIAVDTNVRRVVHRLMRGVDVPRPVSPARVERLAREMLPKGRAHDWNSALMDLGALICTARAPKCGICPVKKHCAAWPIEPQALERARLKQRLRRSPQERLPFARTTRFARGRIVDRLRELPAGHQISVPDLRCRLKDALSWVALDDIEQLLSGLERDGVVRRKGQHVALSD